MSDDRKLSVCLLDLKLSSIRLDAERIVVSIEFISPSSPLPILERSRRICNHVAGVDRRISRNVNGKRSYEKMIIVGSCCALSWYAV
jgi:hypothetical protein